MQNINLIKSLILNLKRCKWLDLVFFSADVILLQRHYGWQGKLEQNVDLIVHDAGESWPSIHNWNLIQSDPVLPHDEPICTDYSKTRSLFI